MPLNIRKKDLTQEIAKLRTIKLKYQDISKFKLYSSPAETQFKR